MKIGSLFSGAGGLDMAVEQIFGDTTIWHVENDPAASKVLRHRWPTVPNYGDITTVNWAQVHPVDVLCGGWPCQPFSHAGKKLGAEDERALWPHVAGAVRLLRPRIVVLENVSAVLTAGEFQRVADDLAALRYEFCWVCVRASDVGAPHRRERLFILATDTDGYRRDRWPVPAGGGEQAQSRTESGCVSLRNQRPAADADGDRVPQRHLRPNQPELAASFQGNPVRRVLEDAADSSGDGRHQRQTQPAGFVGGSDATQRGAGPVNLLPTPRTREYDNNPSGHRRHDPGIEAVTYHFPQGMWGKYAPAIHRWEHVNGPAPNPTEPNRNGNPRLNPAFAEWMMGWPAGHVTDNDLTRISRSDQLRIIGNGVIPQQAAHALKYLLTVTEISA